MRGYLTPTVGTVTTPDPGPLPADECVLVYKVRGPTTSGANVLVCQFESAGQYAWHLVDGGSGRDEWTDSVDGASFTTRSVVAPTPTGGDEWKAFTVRWNGATQTLASWRSPDGTTWLQTGTADHPSRIPFDASTVIRVGRDAFGQTYVGRIYSVELRTGADPAGGSVVWRFDANEYPGTGTSYTDPRGRVWTLSTAAAITPGTTMVHGIVCSYLGDGEYDIGKTAAWLNNFVHTLFFYDLNYGETARKYAVDYSKTFPDAQFAYHPATSKGFYEDAALFRKMAFQAGLAAWKYDDDDWVVFLDASESLSSGTAFDQLPLDTQWPNLLNTLLNEARAGTNAVKFPFFVFLQQGTVTEEFMSADPALGNQLAVSIPLLQAAVAAETDPVEKAALQATLDQQLLIQEANESVMYWTNDPHYMGGAAQYLDRMLKVSYAKTLTTTAGWRRVDEFAQALGQTAVAATVVAYGYARYGEGPPPWTVDTDGGFANRLLLQQVRSVGLPQTYATADPVGVAHPVGTQSPAYAYLFSQYDTGDGNPAFNKYVALWRQNPRDGVWYVNDTLGPTPTDPITGDPVIDPDTWDSQTTSSTGPIGTGLP